VSETTLLIKAMFMSIELTPAEISERTGMGPVETESAESPEAEKVEETKEVEGKEEKKSDEQEIDGEKKTEETEEETEVESKPEAKKEIRQERTVPYGIKGRLEKEVSKRKELEETLSEKVAEGVKAALVSLVKADQKDELPDDVKKAAMELAEETGLDETGVEKLLRKAKELSAKNELPKEVMEKLNELDRIKKERDEKQAEESFNQEWDSFLPNLKKQYPNATDSMLKEARGKMDELAHSKEHHTHEMDYILFKEAKTFETLLKVAPKNKSGEDNKQVYVNRQDVDDEETMVDIEDMTPEIMKQREQRMIQKRMSKGYDKTYTDMTIINPIEN